MLHNILEKPLLLPQKDGLFKTVHLKDILYAEVHGAYIVVRYINGNSEPFALSLTKLEETLPTYLFCRINRNSLVSIYRVDKVGKNYVEIANKAFSLTDNFKKQFLARYYVPAG
ncbi:LytTR family transcriptional regulator DNA-binding domain-containing protein [Chitinophaga rhizophila]|uniref:LytTR family transcriptional regulator DNA-binding domain-containing protein n=1 Tax=Chitinophaga rhizophila TaxID=2866212 RepID=A0ABS7G813_9BACT|nr:LytTR family transcriptional regulator DNA-binding domain-containing protein [Chitinophaga rhizophila]MBW8683784.1 LytTR family transcriptional regulator DNA-binding domain-containing protein [Chitinophaga rhizophila]